MNETLEAIARTIFKSWFVDFDPVHYKTRGEQPPGSQRGFEMFILPAADVDKEVARVALLAKDDAEAAWASSVCKRRTTPSVKAKQRKYTNKIRQTGWR